MDGSLKRLDCLLSRVSDRKVREALHVELRVVLCGLAEQVRGLQEDLEVSRMQQVELEEELWASKLETMSLHEHLEWAGKKSGSTI